MKESDTGSWVESSVDNFVTRELKGLYKSKLLRIENDYYFNKFHYPEILDSELSAKPSLLLVG